MGVLRDEASWSSGAASAQRPLDIRELWLVFITQGQLGGSRSMPGSHARL